MKYILDGPLNVVTVDVPRGYAVVMTDAGGDVFVVPPKLLGGPGRYEIDGQLQPGAKIDEVFPVEVRVMPAREAKRIKQAPHTTEIRPGHLPRCWGRA